MPPPPTAARKQRRHSVGAVPGQKVSFLNAPRRPASRGEQADDSWAQRRPSPRVNPLVNRAQQETETEAEDDDPLRLIGQLEETRHDPRLLARLRGAVQALSAAKDTAQDQLSLFRQTLASETESKRTASTHTLKSIVKAVQARQRPEEEAAAAAAADMATLREQVAAVTREQRALKSKNRKLESALGTSQQQLSDARLGTRNAEARVEQRERDLADAEARLGALREHRAAVDAKHAQETDGLREHIADLQRTATRLQQQTTAAEDTANRLREQLHRRPHAAAAAPDEGKLSDGLERAWAQARAAQAEADAQRDRAEQVAGLLDGARAELAALRGESSSADAASAAAREAARRAREQRDAALRDAMQAKAEATRVAAELDEARQQLERLQEQLRGQRDPQLAEAERRVADAERRSADAKRRAGEAERRARAAAEELARVEAALRQSEAALRRSEQQSEALRAELAAAAPPAVDEGELAAVQQRAAAAEAQVSAVEAQAAETAAQLAAAEARAAEAETRATEAETRATEAETRATEAEARAQQAAKDAQKAAKDAQTANQNTRQAVKEQQAAALQAQQAQQAAEQARQTAEQAQQETRRLQKQVEELQHQAAQLAKQEQARKTLADAQAEFERKLCSVSAERTRLRAELDKAATVERQMMGAREAAEGAVRDKERAQREWGERRAELEQTVAALREEARAARAAAAEAAAARDDAEKLRSAAEQRAHAANDRTAFCVAEVRREMETARDGLLASAAQDAAEHQKRATALEEELKTANVCLSVRRKELEALQAAVGQTDDTAVANLQRQLEDAQRQAVSLRRDLQRAQEQLVEQAAAQDDERRQWRASVSTLQGDKERLSDLISTLKTRSAELQREQDQIVQERAAVAASRQDSTKQLQAVRRQSEKRVAEFEAALAERDERLREAEAKADKARREVQKRGERLRAAEAALAESKAQRIELEAGAERAGELERRLRDADAGLQHAATRRNDYERKLREAAAELKRLQSEADRRLGAAAAAEEEREAELVRLRAALSSSQERVDTSVFDEQQKELDRVRAAFDEQHGEFLKLKLASAQAAKAQDELLRLRAAVAEYEKDAAELAHLRGAVIEQQTQQAEVVRLRRELEDARLEAQRLATTLAERDAASAQTPGAQLHAAREALARDQAELSRAQEELRNDKALLNKVTSVMNARLKLQLTLLDIAPNTADANASSGAVPTSWASGGSEDKHRAVPIRRPRMSDAEWRRTLEEFEQTESKVAEQNSELVGLQRQLESLLSSDQEPRRAGNVAAARQAERERRRSSSSTEPVDEATDAVVRERVQRATQALQAEHEAQLVEMREAHAKQVAALERTVERLRDAAADAAERPTVVKSSAAIPPEELRLFRGLQGAATGKRRMRPTDKQLRLLFEIREKAFRSG